MTIKNSVFILLVFLLFSCSKNEEKPSVAPLAPSVPQAGESAGPLAKNSPPQVKSASIYPENPNTATQLIAHFSGSDPDGDSVNYLFRWYVDGVIVQEGTVGSLDPGKHFKGSKVYVEIIPSDSYAPGKPFLTPETVIGNQPPDVKSVSLAPGDPVVGSVITAKPEGEDPDGDDVTYAYQWGVNGKYVTKQQKENTFNTAGLHKKDMIYVTVTPSDKDASGRTYTSDVIVVLNSAPRITSTPKYELVNGVYNYQVTATDPDGDRLTYSLEKSPEGMTIDPSSGVIRWNAPKQVSGKQEVPIRIIADDGDGGKATQEFSLTIEM